MNLTNFLLIATFIGFAKAFYPALSKHHPEITLAMTFSVDEKPLYDPLNLYGKNSKERKEFRIRTFEPQVKVIKPIIDPMNLYTNKMEVDNSVDMSDSLPFMPRPMTLRRELAGDIGFDPFNFADTEEKLLWQREAELKHGRIAMLAVTGWTLSELFDKPLAGILHLNPLLSIGDRVPSFVNGGLGKVNPLYWILVVAVAGYSEITTLSADEGNTFWDPLSLYPGAVNEKKKIEEAEINNGRLAMLAFTGFTVQEFVTKVGVVNYFMEHNLHPR